MSKGKSKCQKINKKPSEPKLVIFSKSLLENIAYIIVILKRNTSEMRSYMKFYIANPMMTLSILSDFSHVLIFLISYVALFVCESGIFTTITEFKYGNAGLGNKVTMDGIL